MVFVVTFNPFSLFDFVYYLLNLIHEYARRNIVGLKCNKVQCIQQQWVLEDKNVVSVTNAQMIWQEINSCTLKKEHINVLHAVYNIKHLHSLNYTILSVWYNQQSFFQAYIWISLTFCIPFFFLNFNDFIYIGHFILFMYSFVKVHLVVKWSSFKGIEIGFVLLLRVPR